jgi:hypothetical protein
MEKPEGKQEVARKGIFTKQQHYKAVSQWLERLGLVVVASLVIQKIVVSGATLDDPVVAFGIVLTFVIYAAALDLLRRS